LTVAFKADCLGAAARVSLVATVAIGCTPTVDVLGVYFPGWLVSAVIGVVVAYLGVWSMARRPPLRSLGQSGLLFCSLTVSVALITWWALFSQL